jgi:hypothetical protein
VSRRRTGSRRVSMRLCMLQTDIDILCGYHQYDPILLVLEVTHRRLEFLSQQFSQPAYTLFEPKPYQPSARVHVKTDRHPLSVRAPSILGHENIRKRISKVQVERFTICPKAQVPQNLVKEVRSISHIIYNTRSQRSGERYLE